MEEKKEYKYNCENCKFYCNETSKWEKHIETEKHKTGKRKIRADFKGPYKCEKCNYESKNIIMFKQHKLNEHSNKEEREKDFKYYCKLCDIGTFSKDNWNRHITSQRHIKHETNYK
jgi:hypothetical protein